MQRRSDKSALRIIKLAKKKKKLNDYIIRKHKL